MPPVHLLLAADVVYGMERPDETGAAAAAESLVKVFDALSAPRSLILLSQRLQPLQKEAAFMGALRGGFTLRRVDGPLSSPLAFDDALANSAGCGVGELGDGLGVFSLRRQDLNC